MSIRAVANRVLSFKFNQPSAGIAFQDFDANSHFSFSIWLKQVNPSNYDALVSYTGNGSQFIIFRDATTWYVQLSGNGVVLQTVPLVPSATPFGLHVWQLFCITKVGRNIKVYAGNDGFGVPALVSLVANFDVTFDFAFSFFHLAVSHDSAMCNLKYWNVALNETEFEEQSNRWDATSPGGGQTPMWASTLRTPGDISSIANPFTSPDWGLAHAYDQFIPDDKSYEFFNDDPSSLFLQTCPTWLYPLTGPTRTVFVSFNPGTTPINQTTYKAVDFWEFEDRGSVPTFQFGNAGIPPVTITYYAFPFTTGTGKGPDLNWPLLIDDQGNEVSIDFGNVNNQFTPIHTGVSASDIAPVTLTLKNLYAWKYGGQFTWNASIAGPAATANLGYAHLLVVYTGQPTGKHAPPVDDLTGLFIISKGQLTDKYNRGKIVRIPDPTVRTSFFGE